MKRKLKEKNCRIEKSIEVRSDGFSFRVRMKIGSTFINETFFSLEEARTYRDLLRVGKATDHAQEKVLMAKADRKKATGLTIGMLLDRYREEVTVHKKGCKEETYTIGKLQRIANFASLPIYLVDGDVTERLKLELGKTLSSTTVRKYLMLVSHLFKMAVTKRWCSDLRNPVKTIELPKPLRMRNRRIEPDEREYLTLELGKARNPSILPFFELLIETACRRGELLRLAVKDIDLTTKTAILYDTKNGEDRVIGLSSKAASILEPRSGGDGPAQRGFQGFARILSSSDGSYSFRTLKPVPYNGRPAHVHFRAIAANHRDLTTQMYFAGQNEEGTFLLRLYGFFGGFSKQRDRLTVSAEPLRVGDKDELSAKFDIFLERTI
jgi:integrase